VLRTLFSSFGFDKQGFFLRRENLGAARTVAATRENRGAAQRAWWFSISLFPHSTLPERWLELKSA